MMKAFIGTVLVLGACLSLRPVHAEPAKTPSRPSVSDTIKQRVNDWCDAMIAVDIDKLSKLIADDWIDGYPGKAYTKADLLAAVKSGTKRLEACEFGPMDVKELGNVAVIQGTVTEKRMDNGKRSTIRIKFMDAFENRGDRWVVVRSQATKL